MKNYYFIEMTDTFGGEANYCWVHRFIVSASTERGAMRKVCTRTGDTVQCVDRYSELQRWDSNLGAICYFVEWIDAADIADYQNRYSRIEVL